MHSVLALLSCIVILYCKSCYFLHFRTWRLAADRQFTWWAHGVLGRNKRRVIPACVVKAIRTRFPEESGEYVGFKPAEIDFS